MQAGEDRYSRVVGWLKIILPLIALGILSTLFLLSRSTDPDAALPYSEVDVRELAREARIGQPAYSGVTEDGTLVTVAARSARPDPDDEERMLADELTARLETGTGLQTEVVAGSGTVDTRTDTLRLTGAVGISTSTGYRVDTEELDVGLELTWLESTADVRAEGPFGRIAAGGMRLDEGESGDYVLVFNRGVRLVYRPDTEPEN